MKCPECVRLGLTSSLYPSGCMFRHSMFVESYYDPEGHRHKHDPNEGNESASCSNGHQLWIRHSNRCPAPGCDFGKDRSIELAKEPA